MKRLIRFITRKFFTALVLMRCKSHNGKVVANRLTIVSKNTCLGDNINFNGMRITGNGLVKIGNNFHSGEGCLIITANHNYEGNAIPYDNTNIVEEVIIEDNVWIGNRVIILPGVTLGEGCIIQAGSVVVSNIPKCAVAGGHPAKVFKYRDIEHYELLKQKGRFM